MVKIYTHNYIEQFIDLTKAMPSWYVKNCVTFEIENINAESPSPFPQRQRVSCEPFIRHLHDPEKPWNHIEMSGYLI